MTADACIIKLGFKHCTGLLQNMAYSAQVVIVGVVAVAALLIVILIPTSFSDVEYYEVSLLLFTVY